MLFDTLTVEEHLWFFAKLKGISDPKGLKDAVDHMITSIGLEDKRHVATTKLSGGMKRKLSVGIALIGDSKVCTLLFKLAYRIVLFTIEHYAVLYNALFGHFKVSIHLLQVNHISIANALSMPHHSARFANVQSNIE